MRAKNLRGKTRVPINRRGTLNSGKSWFPCLIVDMSENGIQIMSTRPIPIGQQLDFRCELFPEKILECKVEVMHGSEDALGLKIIEIDKQGMDLCQLFLAEQFSENLHKSG